MIGYAKISAPKFCDLSYEEQFTFIAAHIKSLSFFFTRLHDADFLGGNIINEICRDTLRNNLLCCNNKNDIDNLISCWIILQNDLSSFTLKESVYESYNELFLNRTLLRPASRNHLQYFFTEK